MKIDLMGGFGEKGRTSVAVESQGHRILLDAGIKVGASGAEYYPEFGESVADLEALFISHAHEDHVGALSRLLALGYAGPLFMTRETCDETPATLAGYAEARDLRAFPLPVSRVKLFTPGETVDVGNFSVRTGRSGHVVGGVWFHVADGESSAVYSADVVPGSGVFLMDAIPECDLLILDASYGADPVSGATRAQMISKWVSRHSDGCLLPTPLSGRSLELIAAMPGQFAIHASMRVSLEAQMSAVEALLPGVPEMLSSRLQNAADWDDTEALPSMPLLADDGMGRAGPSARLIPRAAEESFPVLLTGHLPAGSPADILHRAGRAEWVRMPTHPTLAENSAIWERAGRPMTLGHSCEASQLDELKIHIPALRSDCRTGQRIAVPQGSRR